MTSKIQRAVAALGLLFLAQAAIAAWTGPTATPPDANTPPPLHVGSQGQIKAGGLTVATGGAITNAFLALVGNSGFGTTTPITKVDVNGDVGAKRYCDENGNNCAVPPLATKSDLSSITQPDLSPYATKSDLDALKNSLATSSDPLWVLKKRYGLEKWPNYLVCHGSYADSFIFSLVYIPNLANHKFYNDTEFEGSVPVNYTVVASTGNIPINRSPGGFVISYQMSSGKLYSGSISSPPNLFPNGVCPTKLHLDGRLVEDLP